MPPPVHGVSVFNKHLLEAMKGRRLRYRLYRVGSRAGLSRPGQIDFLKMVGDALALLSVGISTVRYRLKGKSGGVLYFTPAQGGPAVFRDLAVVALGRLARRRTVGHIHGCAWLTLAKGNGLIPKVMQIALSLCDSVVCLGSQFTKDMQQIYGAKCVTINNGTPLVRTAVPRQLPGPGFPLRLLFLSNFHPGKGLHRAAEATRILRSSLPNVMLQCAGEWTKESDRASFERDFAAEICDGTIEMLGAVDPPGKDGLLRGAHFFMLPTTFFTEGQPLSLIEAMSYGVVPIVTEAGGIRDLMDFEGAEVLMSANHRDPVALAQTVLSLTASPAKYERLSTMCLEHQRANLSFDRCMDELLAAMMGADSKTKALLVA